MLLRLDFYGATCCRPRRREVAWREATAGIICQQHSLRLSRRRWASRSCVLGARVWRVRMGARMIMSMH